MYVCMYVVTVCVCVCVEILAPSEIWGPGFYIEVWGPWVTRYVFKQYAWRLKPLAYSFLCTSQNFQNIDICVMRTRYTHFVGTLSYTSFALWGLSLYNSIMGTFNFLTQ